MNKELSNKCKEIFSNYLIEELKDYKGEVALLLSEGIDSRSMLYLLKELGKEVHIYSFHREGVLSKDFKGARKMSEMYSCNFTELILPTNIDSLKKDVLTLINDYGLKKKSEIECMWVMYKIIPQIKEKYVVTGFFGDGYFGVSKNAILHWSQTSELLDEFRDTKFNEQYVTQFDFMDKLFNEYNIKCLHPFYDKKVELLSLFKGKSWKELNKPKIKHIWYDMFPQEFDKFRSYKHTNYQKGDSQITNIFEQLQQTNWKSGKSVISIYNKIRKGEIKE